MRCEVPVAALRMFLPKYTLVWLAISTVATCCVRAQAPTLAPLTDFVGTYADPPHAPIEIVAGDMLYAVLDEAKYRLQRAGNDAFLNGAGDTIRFQRNLRGRVRGYVERGVLHTRTSPQISKDAEALAAIGPRGRDTSTAYHYRVPHASHDGIPVGDISESDLDVATAERVIVSVLDGTYKDVHGILLYQRGKLVLEEYFYGYSATRPHQLRSATKSLVSALAGVAVDRGAISGPDALVTQRLPYASFAHPDPRKAQITLGQMLTMRPGLACDDHDGTSPGRETVIDDTPDWVKATLDLPMIAEPGTVAHYCSGGVAVVGRMVERAVGSTLPEFAATQLFSKLDIPRTNWQWDYTLTSANREFSQIHLRPRDMLKLGMLYAGGGLWHDRRVLSQAWVSASLAEQTQLEHTGYGYFWWRPWLNVETSAGVQRVTMRAAQGNGGQKIYIVPELDLIAVFTGGDYNSGGSPPNKIMARIILPKLLEARAKK